MSKTIGAALILLAALAGSPAPQEPKTSVREFVTLAGTVDRIERAGRILTLKSGELTHSLYVPPEFTLFDELKVGDTVIARIRESIIVSTRPGLKPQIVTDTTAAAAQTRQTPSDPELLQQLKAVVTIESIDPETRIVTYKTADGRRIIRAVADARLLEGLKAGDVIEVTMTRERVVQLHRQ